LRNLFGLTLMAVAVPLAAVWTLDARAGLADTTARALVADWKNGDREMAAVAEVIASAFASVVRLLKAFGCRILVADPYVQLSAEDAGDGVRHVALKDLLRQSDVVTLHARLTEETRGFIGRPEFAAMPKGATFINTARGPMVDYQALTDALKSGHLRGAAIETFAIEPAPADPELLRLENVTLTPHIAGASLETIERAAVAAAEEVRRYVEGKGPLNPCR
jgi:D-3-phosphoglycerate dehydrogenase / 2-oxoglutarate reductase